MRPQGKSLVWHSSPIRDLEDHYKEAVRYMCQTIRTAKGLHAARARSREAG